MQVEMAGGEQQWQYCIRNSTSSSNNSNNSNNSKRAAFRGRLDAD